MNVNVKAIIGFIVFVIACAIAALLGDYIGSNYPILGLILGIIGLVPMIVNFVCIKRAEKKQRQEYKKWAKINSHFDAFD